MNRSDFLGTKWDMTQLTSNQRLMWQRIMRDQYNIGWFDNDICEVSGHYYIINVVGNLLFSRFKQTFDEESYREMNPLLILSCNHNPFSQIVGGI